MNTSFPHLFSASTPLTSCMQALRWALDHGTE